MSGRFRHWLYTWFNQSEYPHPCIDGECSYWIRGNEICPETGTPHLQCYLALKSPKSFKTLQKMLGRSSNLQPIAGTPEENITYCSKDGDFTEFGKRPQDTGKAGGQATKDKYANTKLLAQAGKLEEIDPGHYIKHYSTLKKIERDFQKIPPDLNWVAGI